MTFDKANSITGSGGVQNSDAAKKPKSTTETKQNIQIDMTGGTKNTPQNPLDFIEELTGKKIMDTPDMQAMQEHLNKSVEEENSKKAQMTPEQREAYEKQQNEALLAGIEERHERAENEKTAFGRWKQGFKDDFKDVDDVGSALNAVVSRTRDGFRAIDKINPLTYVKEPVKNLAEKIDEKVSDGDPSTMTAGEKAWNAAKGAGNVIDYLTSTEGLWVIAATVLTAGTVTEAALSAAPKLAAAAPAANAALGTAGAGIAGKGVYDVVTAENEQEAQKGGAEMFSGGMMVGGAAASAKSSLTAARKAGVPAKDPATLSTFGAIKENFRVAGKGLKVATGIDAPVMGSAIPASAIRFESKPNEVEAYVNTGKADGIVFEKDGKLYVPNKWNPEAPYEVQKGSVIMIYDKAGGDFAVCDPKIFSKTYVDANGSYNAMKGVKPGQVIKATKKAVGGFEIVPEGTKIKTLEGEVTVKKGQAVMYDVDGNPYVGDIEKSLLKRNVPVDDASYRAFQQLKNPDQPVTPGFTDDFVEHLSKQGWGDMYGPGLVKETQQMTVMLENELAKGTKLTQDVVESIMLECSPDASGGSFFTQLRILANNWKHGDIILDLYK